MWKQINTIPRLEKWILATPNFLRDAEDYVMTDTPLLSISIPCYLPWWNDDIVAKDAGEMIGYAVPLL